MIICHNKQLIYNYTIGDSCTAVLYLYSTRPTVRAYVQLTVLVDEHKRTHSLKSDCLRIEHCTVLCTQCAMQNAKRVVQVLISN